VYNNNNNNNNNNISNSVVANIIIITSFRHLLILHYKKEWDVLFKNQIISGNYFKTLFLGAICGSLFFLQEIMPRASIQ